jgi:hypothetical protein
VCLFLVKRKDFFANLVLIHPTWLTAMLLILVVAARLRAARFKFFTVAAPVRLAVLFLMDVYCSFQAKTFS